MIRKVLRPTLRSHSERTHLSTPGPRILYVEDDPSIRETLDDLLTYEGYSVTTAPTAERGLELLQTHRFDLLLTDYEMPGNNGTWMVAEARRRGLLDGTPVIVATAHPHIDNPDRLEVLRKPLDVDEFLVRIHKLLEPARSRALAESKELLEKYSAHGGRKFDLVLYISAHSPASLRAVRNVQQMLARYEAQGVTFRICDLSKEPPEAGDEDRIAFTPTLVKRWPEPRTWILGDLDHNRILQDLLELSGVEALR